MADEERANAARIYDYMLGGAHNFAVDREAAGVLLGQFPWLQAIAWRNRAFLARAVRYCLEQGVDQFLDLGSGVPTVGNVHEVARAAGADVRVAYVDIEPVAVAGARELLAGDPRISVTHADLRQPSSVLAAPGVADLLDLDRPVAVLAVAALHFAGPDDDIAGVLGAYRAVMAPGSVLVVSHGSTDQDDPELAEVMTTIIEVMAASATPAYSRTRAELHALFARLDLALEEPGLVDVAHWGATTPQPAVGVYAAVARTR